MITPLFRLTQDEQYLYVTLVAPNMRLAAAELYYEGEQFVFHASPYYLRLELPGRVKANKEEILETETKKPTIHYDAEKGELVVPVEKAVPGEHFTGLEAIGRLLSGPKSRLSRRLVEVLEENGDPKTPLIEDLVEGAEEEEEDFDWNIEQKLPEEENKPYGFANRYSGVLERLGAELAAELVDLKEPGRKSRAERRAERIAAEEADFDEDHYVADLYDNDEDEDGGENCELLLPNFDQATTKVLLLGLADLLFAYAYDARTTDWEHCSESAWTIRKLSPTLSWFEYWATVEGEGKVESRKTVLASLVRRSLIYPLYRSWRLAMKVAQDVVTILGAGQAAVLKCLIDMHRLLNSSGGEGEHLYLLNDLYIADYCAWVQQLKGGGERLLRRFAEDIGEVVAVMEVNGGEGEKGEQGGGRGQRRRGPGPGLLQKGDVHLELELIERAAAEMWAEAIKVEDKSGDKKAAAAAAAEGLCQRLERSMRLRDGADGDELDSDDDEEPTTSQQ
ncbi:Hsp90 cochaperone shq1 [Tyrophagus putrescentiae]|nr:Hsp90 cochaperone shq1 [Tyrophagus putrescentiae]